MNMSVPHPWPQSVEEAIPLQQMMRAWVIREDQVGPITTVAGIDVGFPDPDLGRAAVAVLDWPGLTLVEHKVAIHPVTMPYVPGFLSFREVPVVLKALEQLDITPDLILCDGQGYAHPRRFGYACHLGVLSGIPTVGVAKEKLVGRHHPVGESPGSWDPLLDGDEIIGAVVRTKANTKPLYISIGHRISLERAVEMVVGCLTRYRLPEPTRWADKLASQRGAKPQDPDQLSLFF